MLGKTEYPASGGAPSAPIKISSANLTATETTNDGLVRSDFIDAVRARFIGPPGAPPLYPDVDPADAIDKVMREFPEALAAMLSVLTDGTSFPASPEPGSAIALIVAAAANTGWPGERSKIPSGFTEIPRFRHYEIAAAMNLMMQAYYHRAVGGGSSGFPPEKP